MYYQMLAHFDYSFQFWVNLPFNTREGGGGSSIYKAHWEVPLIMVAFSTTFDSNSGYIYIYIYIYTGCPKNVTEFLIEITPEIFDLENQFL